MRLAPSILCSLILGLSVALVAPPFEVSAQSQGNGNGSWYGEGSSEWQGEEREHIRGWRHLTSEVQQAVSALPDTAVQNLFVPVLGVAVSDLTPNFGDPRDGGARTHEGLDIIASHGTPVASPTQAVVIRTGVGSNSGIYVYTANPGDETFVYMHLDSVAEGISFGTVLQYGEVLGYVGNTGNASGGGAHLHFEIRRDGELADPYPRLTQVYTMAVASSPVSKATGELPSGDLDIGATGTAVVELQKFLIAGRTGLAAERLAGAGATGYFGPITRGALAEYQAAVGIVPAAGYYGPITRAFIAGTASVGGGQEALVDLAIFSRDLELGMVGEDVRALQVYLNQSGHQVAAAGSGAPGSETGYFGPLTRAALVSFQLVHRISPAVGYFGPITRSTIASS